MPIYFDLSSRHRIIAANAHFYKLPTEERYIDRILQCHDLIYLIDGAWSITENDQDYPLAAGDVLLLAAGRHHYTRLPCLPGTRTFCIHVTCEPGDNAECERALSLPSLLHMRASSSIKSYFEDIVSTYWIDSPYKQEKASALLDLLLLQLRQEQLQQHAPQVDFAAKAIELITAAPHHRYQSKEVADMLHISTKTLDNAMRLRVGMPFYSYQKNRKLEMVASQLEMEPDLRLGEIATAYGFYDEFHMSKAFKQKYNISPQNYRKSRLSAIAETAQK
jgi:AraC-like DNA-binding protein